MLNFAGFKKFRETHSRTLLPSRHVLCLSFPSTATDSLCFPPTINALGHSHAPALDFQIKPHLSLISSTHNISLLTSTTSPLPDCLLHHVSFTAFVLCSSVSQFYDPYLFFGFRLFAHISFWTCWPLLTDCLLLAFFLSTDQVNVKVTLPALPPSCTFMFTLHLPELLHSTNRL